MIELVLGIVLLASVAGWAATHDQNTEVEMCMMCMEVRHSQAIQTEKTIENRTEKKVGIPNGTVERATE